MTVKIKSTEYSIEFSFLLFNAVVFILKNNILVMTFYGVCIIHELGHLCAIWLTGGKVKSVNFKGTGIIITPEKNSRHELLIMLSGAGANILTFMILSMADIFGTFRVLNICTAIYNLLPYRQLDGGTALHILTDGTPHEVLINTILDIIKILLSVILFISGIYNYNYIILFIVSVMLFVSERRFQ